MPTLPIKLSRFRLVVLTVASLLLVGAYFAAGYSRGFNHSYSPNRLTGLPDTILWAWERPEKLDYLDPQATGVAFLAKTIYLRGDRVVSRPRLQPLSVPPGAQVIAVVRIESERAEPPVLSAQQVNEAALEVSEASRLPNVAMVQVDFDATTSERDFYRSLLTELRARLPQSTLLSITALASWCKGDNWLDGLPIDEAVPMLFRMGVERKQFLSQLAAGERFNAKLCQASAGISIDEPVAQLPRVERVYVFNPTSWSPSQVNQVMKETRR
ncbi:MAG TPA: DUF3142 domain-containing protein [Pyrinomonadaceae bacterium]|nr:DUF3142 domain-containing protein [Pyrinomonadaceae bacterium]